MKRLFSSILLATMCAAHAAEFYVSPSGNDGNSGFAKEAPLKTFGQVLKRVEALPKKWESDVVVHVMPGEYFIASPIDITSEHSSVNNRKLIFRNHGALGSAVLLGGKRLDNRKWQVQRPGLYYQNLPGVEEINMIYEDGMKARKARFPDYRHLKDFPTADGDYFISRKVGRSQPYLSTRKEDISQTFMALLHADMKAGVEQYLVTWGHGSSDWHKWVYPIAKIVPEENQVFVTEPTPTLHQNGKEDHNRYYIEGGLRLLDRKGEFYFDTQKERLYYMPRGQIETTDILYSTVMTLFRVSKAKHVSFEGLRFACTSVLPYYSYAFPWNDPDAALSIIDSSKVEIRACHFKSIGQSAINLETSHHCIIEDSLLEYMGQSGVKLFNSNHNVIRNCLIHDIGLRRVYCEGVALYASRNNTVSHMEIYNSARYGLTIRGRVTPDKKIKETPATENRVDFIKMYNLNQDSGDSAGLQIATINNVGGPFYTNYLNQITITRSVAQPNITEEWAPTGVYLDHAKMVMHQSLSNIEVKAYDPRYKGYTVERFNGMYGDTDRTGEREKQIMQHRPDNNASSTKFNCSWSDDFDKKHMQYDKIGLTDTFPREFLSAQRQAQE